MWFQEARPSPERLDAQIRHLVHSRDTATQNILEQNKALLEQIKAVVDGLKENKLVMEEIKVWCVVWSALLIILILRSFDIGLLLLVSLGFWTSSVLLVFRVWQELLYPPEDGNRFGLQFGTLRWWTQQYRQ